MELGLPGNQHISVIYNVDIFSVFGRKDGER